MVTVVESNLIWFSTYENPVPKTEKHKHPNNKWNFLPVEFPGNNSKLSSDPDKQVQRRGVK